MKNEVKKKMHAKWQAMVYQSYRETRMNKKILMCSTKTWREHAIASEKKAAAIRRMCVSCMCETLELCLEPRPDGRAEVHHFRALLHL
jgi:hypothetical protein